MSSHSSLTLMIPVYKGGTYWQECWASVKPLAKYFDRILISFNKSELQKQDFSVIDNGLYENLKYIMQPNYLEPIAHFLNFLPCLQTKYVFFFATMIGF